MTTNSDWARRNRFTLLMLVVVFALPPLLGWLFVMNPQWLSGGTINKGTLVHPPRPVSGLSLLNTESGRRFDWGELRDKWVFVAINRGDCGEQCIARLINLRQLRRALGAESRRVARALILLPESVDQLPEPPPMAGLEGTLMLRAADLNVSTEVAALFELEQIDTNHHLFIIDPRGDLMMRHDLAALKAKEILKDIELLLKASANWVQGD